MHAKKNREWTRRKALNRRFIRLRKACLLRPLFPELWRTRRRDPAAAGRGRGVAGVQKCGSTMLLTNRPFDVLNASVGLASEAALQVAKRCLSLTRPYLRLSAVGLCLRAYSRPFAVSYFVSIRGSSLREIILPTHFRDRSFSRVGYNHLRKTLAAAGKRHS